MSKQNLSPNRLQAGLDIKGGISPQLQSLIQSPEFATFQKLMAVPSAMRMLEQWSKADTIVGDFEKKAKEKKEDDERRKIEEQKKDQEIKKYLAEQDEHARQLQEFGKTKAKLSTMTPSGTSIQVALKQVLKNLDAAKKRAEAIENEPIEEEENITISQPSKGGDDEKNKAKDMLLKLREKKNLSQSQAAASKKMFADCEVQV